jgi:hypothetical protein
MVSLFGSFFESTSRGNLMFLLRDEQSGISKQLLMAGVVDFCMEFINHGLFFAGFLGV